MKAYTLPTRSLWSREELMQGIDIPAVAQSVVSQNRAAKLCPERRSEAERLIAQGCTLAQIVQNAKVSRVTAIKLRREVERGMHKRLKCKCGKSIRHLGWCSHRLENSQNRQAYNQKRKEQHLATVAADLARRADQANILKTLIAKVRSAAESAPSFFTFANLCRSLAGHHITRQEIRKVLKITGIHRFPEEEREPDAVPEITYSEGEISLLCAFRHYSSLDESKHEDGAPMHESLACSTTLTPLEILMAKEEAESDDAVWERKYEFYKERQLPTE